MKAEIILALHVFDGIHADDLAERLLSEIYTLKTNLEARVAHTTSVVKLNISEEEDE